MRAPVSMLPEKLGAAAIRRSGPGHATGGILVSTR